MSEKNELELFYSKIDEAFEENAKSISVKLSECMSDIKHYNFTKWINQEYNVKSQYKRVYRYFDEFCKKYQFNFKKDISGWRGISINRIYKNALINNCPSTWETMKNLVKFQVLAYRDFKDEYSNLITEIIIINTIKQYCPVSKIDLQYGIDKNNLSNIFWCSRRIKKMCSEVMNEINNKNEDIYSSKNELIWPIGKKEGINLLAGINTELSKERMEQIIGNETMYNKAMKLIIEKIPGATKRKVIYALEKTGLADRLVKRPYKKKKEPCRNNTKETSPTEDSMVDWVDSLIVKYEPSNKSKT